jgi:hypothetical protein
MSCQMRIHRYSKWFTLVVVLAYAHNRFAYTHGIRQTRGAKSAHGIRRTATAQPRKPKPDTNHEVNVSLSSKAIVQAARMAPSYQSPNDAVRYQP